MTFLLHLLETEENEKIQALLCMGIAKLMLAGMITDERVSERGPFGGPTKANLAVLQVLKSLVLMYVSPETADNQELRQCLAYFFPVYCYSNPLNQRRMQQVMLVAYVNGACSTSSTDLYPAVRAACWRPSRME